MRRDSRLVVDGHCSERGTLKGGKWKEVDIRLIRIQTDDDSTGLLHLWVGIICIACIPKTGDLGSSYTLDAQSRLPRPLLPFPDQRLPFPLHSLVLPPHLAAYQFFKRHPALVVG